MEFPFSNHGLSWSTGDTVPVKLVRTNTAPTFSAGPQTRSIAENTAAGTNVGAAIPAATDTDGDTLTYSMEGADATSFNFNASTRQITTKAGVTYDYETKSSYSVTIKADDGNGGTATIAVTINLTDVNEGTPPSTAHCNPSDPLELWCATMTVGTTSQSGFTYTGYAIADNTIPAFGSIAPNTFTYRTATISVDILEYEGNSVFFEIARSSGTTPADGLLGPDTFTLEVGTGGTKNSFAIVNPGTTNYFEFPDPGLSWSVDDTVPVKLVRTNAAPTVATVIPDQTATAGTAFSYAFPDTTFSDADGDTLTYTATQADGTDLPLWLSFTAGTLTFSGTPQTADVATVSVKVTASDGSASVSDTFDIVVSAAGDTTAPTLTSALVSTDGELIVLDFSENLQTSNVPPASTVTVTADGSEVTVASFVWRSFIDENQLLVTLSPSSAITQGQTVVVTYTDPTTGDDANAIQDTAGNDTATFTTGMNSVPAVTNNSTVVGADTTRATLTSAVANQDGLFIQLQFSENVDRSNLTPASAVTVTAGASPLTITGVTVPPPAGGLDKYWVLVTPAIRQGQAVIVTYTDPTAGNDANAIQDTAGNDAASFTTGSDGVPAVTNGSNLTNTAPTAADGTVTARPNTNYSFSAANFNFRDADRDALSSVKIVTLPATGKGTLSLSGTAIPSGDLPKTVTAIDLSAGRLKYAPPSGESGSALASFTFRVNDGRSDSTAAFTMTINVAQNTAPTSANNTVMTRQDAEYRFFISDFNYGARTGIGFGA